MEKIEVPIVIVYIFSSILFALLLLTLLVVVKWLAREIRTAHNKVEAMLKLPHEVRLWYSGKDGQPKTTVMSQDQYAAYLQALEDQANKEDLEANRSYPWQD